MLNSPTKTKIHPSFHLVWGWFHLVRFGFIWFVLVSSGLVWFHLVRGWFRLVRFGFIWFGLVSSGLGLVWICLCVFYISIWENHVNHNVLYCKTYTRPKGQRDSCHALLFFFTFFSHGRKILTNVAPIWLPFAMLCSILSTCLGKPCSKKMLGSTRAKGVDIHHQTS